MADVTPIRYPNRIGNAWMNRAETAKLNHLIAGCERVLEIGSASGVTISLIAEAHPSVKFLSVDTYVALEFKIKNTGKADLPGSNINSWVANKQPNQSLFVGKAWQLLEWDNRKYDLIIVDGGHDYRSVCADLEASLSLLKPGGIIAGHDYASDWPEVVLAFDEFLTVHPEYVKEEVCCSLIVIRYVV